MAEEPATEADPVETKDDQSGSRIWEEWLSVGVGLTALLSLTAIVLSLVAISSTGNSSSTPTVKVAAATTPAPATMAPVVQTVSLTIKTDEEHGRKGPDGQWHDAFQGGDFSVDAGHTVKVTVANYDDAPHSFTAPSVGVNVTIPGGSKTTPHMTTFTFTAPTTGGSFQWFCALPCDPWAMSHDGYMRGHVTVHA